MLTQWFSAPRFAGRHAHVRFQGASPSGWFIVSPVAVVAGLTLMMIIPFSLVEAAVFLLLMASVLLLLGMQLTRSIRVHEDGVDVEGTLMAASIPLGEIEHIQVHRFRPAVQVRGSNGSRLTLTALGFSESPSRRREENREVIATIQKVVGDRIEVVPGDRMIAFTGSVRGLAGSRAALRRPPRALWIGLVAYVTLGILVAAVL